MNDCRKYIKKYPRLHKYTKFIHHKYSYIYIKYLIIRYCGCNNANENTPEVVKVDPDKIKYVYDPGFRPVEYQVCPIIGGRWDLNLPEFEEYSVYKSFKKHFEDSISWERTQYYHEIINRVNSGDAWHGCTTETDVRNRLQKYDALYKEIKNKGYKTQRELIDESATPLEPLTNRTPEMHEITVDIGRDGSYILEDGRHRLSIVKLLQLNEIPVRILVRHRQLSDMNY